MNFYQYIDGKLARGEGAIRKVFAPGTGQEIVSIAGASRDQTLLALDSAQKAFKSWSSLSLNERGNWILRLRDAIKEHQDELVELLSLESGKPRFSALRGFTILYDALSYYYEEAKRLYGSVIPDYNSDSKTYHICEYKPIGVVVSHLAWNMPLLNIGAKLAPVLASGCTCVLKPASYTPLTALKLGEIAESIGFPTGVINIVSGTVDDVASVLNASPIPKMITLIGSTQTGLQVIRDSSGSLKTYSLELGGNAPAIVMDNADIEAAANFIANMKMNNSGQLCTSINRAIVHESVIDRFCDIIEKKFRNCKVGWGNEPDIDMGPMISLSERDRVVSLISDAVTSGAQLVCGGEIPDNSGYYLTPALLRNVANSMSICKNEIFGPVLPVLSFKTIDEAISIANDTDYGLSAYAYTSELHTAFRLNKELEAGEIFINVWGGGSPLPYPHGGVKNSGYGKDWSEYSLKEYYYIKRFAITP